MWLFGDVNELYSSAIQAAGQSHRTAQALQDFCDEAQVAAGNPDGEDQLQDIRELLAEHTAIVSGEGFLMHQLRVGSEEESVIVALAFLKGWD